MCYEAVDNYAYALEFVPDYCKTQEMCDQAVDTCPFAFDSVPDRFKTQEICDKVVSEELFVRKYRLGRYNTQKNM